MSLQHSQNVEVATLKNRKWLCQKYGQKAMVLQLEISNNESVEKENEMASPSFDAGDYAVIFAANSDEDVTFTMKHLMACDNPTQLTADLQLMEYDEKKGQF